MGGESRWETDAMERGIDNIQETPEKTATCVYDFRQSSRDFSGIDRPIGHVRSLGQMARLRPHAGCIKPGEREPVVEVLASSYSVGSPCQWKHRPVKVKHGATPVIPPSSYLGRYLGHRSLLRPPNLFYLFL